MAKSVSLVADTPDVVATTPRSNPHVLSEAGSLLLDAVRLSAALVVLFGHLTFARFGTGLADKHLYGEYSVPVFFVLSGLVIRFVTRAREHTATKYFVDRLSRMYSVVLPAMALTLLAAAIGYMAHPAWYMEQFGDVSNRIAARVLMNISFLSQIWGLNSIPLIDPPFWSLGYECPYYIAYGLIFFLRGRRRFWALFGLALLCGPQLLFLFPIWWLGCIVYDLYHRLRTVRAVVLACRAISLSYVALGFLLRAEGRPELLLAPFRALYWFSQLPNVLTLLHLRALRPSMLAFGIGVLAGIALLILLLAVEGVAISTHTPAARYFRRAADGTFAIYLGHYPLLVLAQEFGLLRPYAAVRNIGVGVLIALLLMFAAVPTDTLKTIMRKKLTLCAQALRLA